MRKGTADPPWETSIDWNPSSYRLATIHREMLAVFDLEYRASRVQAMEQGVSGLRRLKAERAFLSARHALGTPRCRGGGLPAAVRHLRSAERELGLYGQDQLAIMQRGVRVGGAGYEAR